MSEVAASKSETLSSKRLVADTFARSIIWTACLIIMQRGIGFLRSFYVCGALAPNEVGQWDLAFNFLSMVAPLAVLGIPGSFGRYVAFYEKNGQQRQFLKRTVVACLALTCLASLLIRILRSSIAVLFFGDTASQDTVALLAIGLPVVVFFNFASSWFTGVRLNRIVFRIQFAQTLFFAFLCVIGVQTFAATATSVIIAYFLSCLIGLCLAASYSVLEGTTNEAKNEAKGDLSIWRNILPFAVWVWISNALFNLFSVCDRMLLVNFYPDKNVDVQFLIGQYHTASIFPLLLMSIGSTAGCMLIPYLSKDWESGSHQTVRERMNLMLKSIGIFCLASSIGILVIAPQLFGGIWKDKFAMGESLLPFALCYSSLAAMTFLAQKYFWCIEKTWLGSSSILLGLITNFGLGVILIGPYGIEGVVISTLVAHAVVLTSVLTLCNRNGLKIDFGVYVVAATICSVSFGAVAACVSCAGLVLIGILTELLFTHSEKALVLKTLKSAGSKLIGAVS
ncbi:MAG: oligosaccharide flippase family protein [Pirellulaceae bacterium]